MGGRLEDEKNPFLYLLAGIYIYIYICCCFFFQCSVYIIYTFDIHKPNWFVHVYQMCIFSTVI